MSSGISPAERMRYDRSTLRGERFLLQAPVDAALLRFIDFALRDSPAQHVDAMGVLFEDPAGDLSLERSLATSLLFVQPCDSRFECAYAQCRSRAAGCGSFP